MDIKASMPRTVFLADPVAKEHDVGSTHPERPARWDAAVRGLGEQPLFTAPSRAASPEELELAHTAEYIRTAQHDVEAGRSQLTHGRYGYLRALIRRRAPSRGNMPQRR